MDKVIDTTFEEISSSLEEDNYINGEPLYYNTMQVAKILDENDSTIRYWSKSFQSILNIKISNKMKKYTKEDIEKIKFIKHLIRVDGLTIRQVEEYCSNKGFDDKQGLIDQNNPLAVQTFISAMTVEFENKMTEMQNNIIKQQQEMIDSLQNIIITNNEKMKSEIAITVDEVVTEKLNEFKESMNEETEATKKLSEMDDKLKYLMESRKQESESNQKEKQHWWNKFIQR